MTRSGRPPVALLLLVACLAAPAAAAADAPARANILLILADDMGYSDLGCYGGEIATPNLDALAAGGLRFTAFHNTGRCWPTRSAILSGYYPQQLRADPPRGPLPAWARLAPHYLKPAGYRCYHSGKWHVPGAATVLAHGGFDRSYRTEDHDRFFNPKNHLEDDVRLPPVEPNSGHYSTTFIADHAIRCLKDHAANHAGKPFFLYLAFLSPHFPLHAPPEDVARYRDRYLQGWDATRAARVKRLKDLGVFTAPPGGRDPDVLPAWNLDEQELLRRIGPGESARALPWDDLTPEQQRFQATKMAIHAAMVDRMDREVGRVIGQLKAMDALDDTLILFASDNGASAEQIIRGDGHDPALPPGSAGTFLCLGPGWAHAANAPFRLYKTYVHEGGVATPLIAHWPRGIPAAARGQLRRTPGHVVDVVPTILDVAGVTWTDSWNGVAAPPLAGRSLRPAFAADVALERDPLFFHHEGHRALRDGDWKIVSLKGRAWELYDLAADPAETRDLAGAHPQRVQSMAARWQELEATYRQQAGPPPAHATRPAATRPTATRRAAAGR